MGLFLIVFSFNLLWLSIYGWKGYLELYNFKPDFPLSGSLAFLYWMYAAWGVYNLITYLLKQ